MDNWKIKVWKMKNIQHGLVRSEFIRVQNSLWVILLNLVHTGYLQFLAIFHNLAGNEHGFLAKTSKTPIKTPK